MKQKPGAALQLAQNNITPALAFQRLKEKSLENATAARPAFPNNGQISGRDN